MKVMEIRSEYYNTHGAQGQFIRILVHSVTPLPDGERVGDNVYLFKQHKGQRRPGASPTNPCSKRVVFGGCVYYLNALYDHLVFEH